MTFERKRQPSRICDAEAATWDKSDWASRSTVDVSPGVYRMRNGHRARVRYKQTFHAFTAETRERTTAIFWFGKCINCGEGCSWNANGTYAANGRHGFDLIERLG